VELVGIIASFVLITVAVVVASYVIDKARERERRSMPKPSRWEVVTFSSLGDVVVALRRNRDTLTVATVPNGAKDWDERVMAAQAEAAQRAAILNAEV
jgi:hypothetical protein